MMFGSAALSEKRRTMTVESSRPQSPAQDWLYSLKPPAALAADDEADDAGTEQEE